MRSSIRSYLLRLVFAVVMPLVGLVAWNFHEMAERDTARAHDRLLNLAMVTASDTARFLSRTGEYLQYLEARPAIRALDSARCDPVLRDFIGLAQRYTSVVTLDAQGYMICSARPVPKGARGDPKMFLDFLGASDTTIVGRAGPGVITGKWVLPIGRALLDSQGRAAGAVVVAVDLANFPVLPSVADVEQDAVVGLIDADGTVLARSKESKAFVGTRLHGAAELSPFGAMHVSFPDREPQVMAAVPVHGTRWMAYASVPANAIYVGLKQRLVGTALLALAIIGAALLLAAYWSRRIATPIAGLARAASEVAAGDLLARAPAEGPREIAHVAAQFNRMLDRRSRMEAELREAERRFRDMLAGVELISVVLDRRGRILFCSDFMLRITGWHSDEVNGQDFFALFSPPQLGELRDQFFHAMACGRIPLRSQTEILTKGGERLLVRWNHTVLRSPEGSVVGTASIGEDVTERTRAEAALVESRELLQLVIQHLPAMVAYFDADLKCRFANAQYCSFQQRAPHEVIGRTLEEIVGPPAYAAISPTLEAVKAGRPVRLERQQARPGGEPRHIEINRVPNMGPDGAFRGYYAMLLDITERRHAEQALRDSEERHRSALDKMLEGCFIFDRDWRYVYVNESGAWQSRHAKENLVGRTLLEVFPGIEDTDAFRRLDQCMQERVMHRSEVKFVSADASEAWFDVSMQPVPEGSFVLSIDITERRRAQEALRESGARLEALTRKLLEAQETERRRIARELHDEVGGVLTAVKLNLQSLRARRSKTPGEAAITDGLALVDCEIDTVRSLSLDLRPAVLDDLGLVPAIRWYSERQSQRAGIPIKLRLDAVDLKRLPQLESACFRIVQEGLTNALRHAHAAEIQVALRCRDAALSIAIADNGRGFDVAAVRRLGQSSGLLGMEERVKLLGGRLRIDSAPGTGTRVRAQLPVLEEGRG